MRINSKLSSESWYSNVSMLWEILFDGENFGLGYILIIRILSARKVYGRFSSVTLSWRSFGIFTISDHAKTLIMHWVVFQNEKSHYVLYFLHESVNTRMEIYRWLNESKPHAQAQSIFHAIEWTSLRTQFHSIRMISFNKGDHIPYFIRNF